MVGRSIADGGQLAVVRCGRASERAYRSSAVDTRSSQFGFGGGCGPSFRLLDWSGGSRHTQGPAEMSAFRVPSVDRGTADAGRIFKTTSA